MLVEAKNQNYQKKLARLLEEKTEMFKDVEDRYHALLDNLKDAVYEITEKGEFTYMNRAAVDLFGYSKDELMKMNAAELYVHSTEQKRFQKKLERDGFVKDFEIKLRKKTGSVLECLLTASISINQAGYAAGCQTIVRNITPDKRAADKIREQEDFLKYALDALLHPFLVINTDDYTVKMANKAANIYDISDGITCHELTHGLSQPCSLEDFDGVCPLEAVMKTKEPVKVEHEHYSKDGQVRNFEIHCFPIFDSKDRVTQVLEYTMDVTERKVAEQELRLLGTAVEQSADSIVITNPGGIIQYVNPTFESVFGYGRDEVIGQSEKMLRSDQRTGRVFSKSQATIINGSVWKGHIINKKKDGNLFEEEVTISPVKDKNGEILNYVAIKRDVTEKNRLESIAEATNLMKNLGFIFSGIRHEIGNPVNSIKMALTVLAKNLKTYSQERIEEFVKRALADVLRVEYLLKTLKNFSMFERPDIQKIRMDKFIQNFISLVKEDIEKNGIRIKTSLSSDTIRGLGDPRALQQVMLNLLTNAADSLEGRPKPQIIISINKVSELIQIRMIDNGCGFSEEERQNLFKPFFTSKAHGTGLGLVIVKKMLASMNSSIKIESNYKIGTTATICIPEYKLDSTQ